MKKHFFLAFLCLVCVKSILIAQNNLSFEEEELTFNLGNGIFSVQGVYSFSAPAKAEYTIKYPFPTDTIYGMPFDISVRYFGSGKPIFFRPDRNLSCIIFKALISKNTLIYIGYSQPLKKDKAKYILLTTQEWNKPLKLSNIKLATDTSLVIKSFSIKPDKKISVLNKIVYFWQKEDFWPQTDFEVVF